MDDWSLRLSEDRLAPAARLGPLPPPNRVLYVREGAVDVAGAAVGANATWHGAATNP